MNWNIFHEGMMEKSETYRGLPDEVKQMFLLNMMDLGVVLTPYPMVYGNNQLMIRIPRNLTGDRKPERGGRGPGRSTFRCNIEVGGHARGTHVI